MNLQEFRTKYKFFEPGEYGKIYTFVDFGNVRSWARDMWPEENKYKFSI